jgi:hypothetical protein
MAKITLVRRGRVAGFINPGFYDVEEKVNVWDILELPQIAA